MMISGAAGRMVLLVLLVALSGCMTTGEQALLPEPKEGLFYNEFAVAQQEALANDKHILLEFWRPG